MASAVGMRVYLLNVHSETDKDGGVNLGVYSTSSKARSAALGHAAAANYLGDPQWRHVHDDVISWELPDNGFTYYVVQWKVR